MPFYFSKEELLKDLKARNDWFDEVTGAQVEDYLLAPNNNFPIGTCLFRNKADSIIEESNLLIFSIKEPIRIRHCVLEIKSAYHKESNTEIYYMQPPNNPDVYYFTFGDYIKHWKETGRNILPLERNPHLEIMRYLARGLLARSQMWQTGTPATQQPHQMLPLQPIPVYPMQPFQQMWQPIHPQLIWGMMQPMWGLQQPPNNNHSEQDPAQSNNNYPFAP